MPLTVRLDPTLEQALERYCAGNNVSKSLVVQESLAAYLVSRAPPAGDKSAAKPPSANYKAFADAGFLGAIALGRSSADKLAVRERIKQRLTRPKPQAPQAPQTP